MHNCFISRRLKTDNYKIVQDGRDRLHLKHVKYYIYFLKQINPEMYYLYPIYRQEFYKYTTQKRLRTDDSLFIWLVNLSWLVGTATRSLPTECKSTCFECSIAINRETIAYYLHSMSLDIRGCTVGNGGNRICECMSCATHAGEQWFPQAGVWKPYIPYTHI